MDSDRDTLHGAGCPNSSYVQQLGGSVTAWCWIMMDSVLYSPDRDTLHGAGCPNSSYVQQLGGSVTAWCWILAHSGSFLAKVGWYTAWCCIMMDSVQYSPDRDTLHGGWVSQFQLRPTVGWYCYCMVLDYDGLSTV